MGYSDRKFILYRWLAVVLAIGIPSLIGWAYQIGNERMNALMSRGRQTTGIITDIRGNRGSEIAYYSYVVDGLEYHWNVDATKAPADIGSKVIVTYLPENPRKNWVGPPLSTEMIYSESAILRKAMIVSFGVFAVSFFLNEYQYRRFKKSTGDSYSPYLSANSMSALLTGAGLVILLRVNFDPKVREVQAKALGAHPMGLPLDAVVFGMTILLYSPYIWINRHIAKVVLVDRGIDPGSPDDPAYRKSKRIAFAGVFYGLGLVITWIAYAAYRGI